MFRYHYFVSYSWNFKNQVGQGFGHAEIIRNRPVHGIDGVRGAVKTIEEYDRPELGTESTVIILSFHLMRRTVDWPRVRAFVARPFRFALDALLPDSVLERWGRGK